MEHLTDGQIAALMDGELGDEDARRVRGHLRECERCRERRRQLSEVSARLDETLERGLRPPEELAPDPDVGGGRPGRPGAAGSTAPAATRDGGLPKVLKTAAAVVALLGAGAVAVDAALPGSPLRDLVVEAVGGGSGVGPEPAPEEVPAETAPPARRGLAVSPVEGRIELVVRGAAEGTRVHVARTEESRARISAPGGRFRTDPGRLEVVEPAGGDILVSVPLGTEEWRLVVNGRTALRGSTGRIIRPDSGRVEWGEEGAYVVVAGPPRR